MKLFWTVIAALCLAIFHCDAQRLSTEAFDLALKNAQNPTILDLRGQSIFQNGHLATAINIDYDEDNFEEIIRNTFDKKTELFIYAGSDYITDNAIVFLNDLGYDTIISLKGGFSEWIAASKPYKSIRNSYRPLATYTPQQFNKIKQKYPKLLVFLEAPACKYCKKMKPFLSEFSQQKGFKLLKIDIAQNQNMAYFFNTHSTPTLLIFEHQKQVWKGEGFRSKEEVSHLLKRYLP